MVGQAEVVVRAEVQHAAVPQNVDAGFLRRRQHAFALEQPGGANLRQLIAQVLLETFTSHGLAPHSRLKPDLEN